MAATTKKKSRRTRANSKSGAVRAYLQQHPAAGPTEVVQALKKNGIQISPAYVSTLKAAAKRTSGANGRMAIGSRQRPGRKAATSDALSLSSLIEARAFVVRVGGVEQATALVQALAKLQA